jgi:heavy metal sensor kinase
MRRPTLSIRWRLTLWNVALLGLALAILGAAFYFGLRFLLYDALDDNLRNRAAIVDAAIERDGDSLRLTTNAAVPSDDDEFIRVWSADGALLFDSSDPEDEPVRNPAGLAGALAGQTSLRWVESDDDDPVRILAAPVYRDGEIAGALEAGIESEVDETLGFALRLLGISIPLILLLAAGGGYWLAGRALNPIDRITRTAADIGERDLSRRIEPDLPDDELGRLARTFNAMLDRIEDAFTRQRRFTADAAHELRTPLALMRSQIDIALRKERDPDADRETLEDLGADVDRLARMSAGLLALARRDAGGLQPEREPVELAALLDLIAEQYQPLANEAGVEILLDTETVTLVADQDQLIQVFVNLLDNALHHAPPGSRISLGCRPEDGSARFWVTDEGPGIAPEHLPHLFERFYRVDPGRDRRHGGIGLGLAISKAIIDAHGGTIEIESAPGAGTTARVSLPGTLEGNSER